MNTCLQNPISKVSKTGKQNYTQGEQFQIWNSADVLVKYFKL